MKFTFSIALILLLFSSCTTAKQVKRYAAPQVKMMLEGELPRLQDNISVVLDSSIVVPDSMIETKMKIMWFLPLMIAILDEVRIKGTVSPEVLASRFSWHLSNNADLPSYKGILDDKALKVIVKSIPTSFVFSEYNCTVGSPFGTGGASTLTSLNVKPIGHHFEFEYQIISATDTTKFEKFVFNMEPVAAAKSYPQIAIERYFRNWDYALNQASMNFLRKLMMDQDANKK